MLPEPAALLLFMAATLGLNITPGPDMIYVFTNSVGRGRTAGLVSALSIGAGCIVHTVAAALGLSAILMSSPMAYDAVRYAGAAYLLFLGIKAFRAKTSPILVAGKQMEPERLSRVFWQGVTTSVLNPKVGLFFLAFIPQFVDPSRGSVGLQFLALGTLFNISGTIVNALVAVAAGSAGEWMGNRPGFSRAQRWFTGGMFVALGARIAMPK